MTGEKPKFFQLHVYMVVFSVLLRLYILMHSHTMKAPLQISHFIGQ